MKLHQQNRHYSISRVTGLVLLITGFLLLAISAACYFFGFTKGAGIWVIAALFVIAGFALFFSALFKNKTSLPPPTTNKDPNAEHYDPANISRDVPSTPPPFIR